MSGEPAPTPDLTPQLTAALEALPLCAAVYSALRDHRGRIVDFRVEFVNASACESSGLSREQQLGQRLCDLHPGHRDCGLFGLYCEVVDTGRSLEREGFEYTDFFGERLKTRTLRLHAGKLGDGIVATWSDAPPAQTAEPGPRVRLVVEGAGFGAYDYDVETGVSLWSAQLRAIIDLPGAGPVPRSVIHNLVHPDDQAQYAHTIEQALDPRGPGRHEIEFRIVRPSGEIRWVRDTGRTYFDGEAEQRRPVRVVGTVLDITDRKRAEAALHESQLRYHALFNAIDQGFCIAQMILDEQGAPVDYRIIDANPAFETFTGLHNWREGTVFELIPTLERWWAQTYGRIALTGEAERFENYAAPMGKWFEVFAFRFGDPARLQVAIFFKDVTERKRYESALVESEAKFKNMANTAPALLWVTDENNQCTFLSRGWHDYTGQSEEEGLGMGWIDAVHPDDRDMAGRIFLDAAAERQPFAFDYRLRNASGEYRWAIDAGRPRFDDSGAFLGYIGSVIDVHERRRADEVLRAGQERQAFLLELSDALRPLADPKEIKGAAARVLGKRLGVNRAFYAEIEGDDWMVVRGYEHGVTPLPDGAYSAQTFGPWIMQTYRAGHHVVFRDTQTDPRFAPGEKEAHARAGVIGAVGVPMVKEGRLVAIFAVHTAAPRDWTEDEILLVEETAERTWAAVERARAEAALRQSASFYRQTLDSIPGMSFTNTPDGKCDFVSDQWVQFTGVPAEEQLGDGWIRMLHPDDRDRAFAAWRAAVEGRGEYDVEYRILRHDGAYEWFKVRGRPIRDAQGAIARWFGTAVNIHNLKEAEQALQQANRELERFVSIASHDLKEPLRGVATLASFILEDDPGINAESRARLERTRQLCERLIGMVNGLLDYARSGGERLNQPCDLEQIARSAADKMAERTREQDAQVTLRGPLPKIEGDPVLLERMFANLIANGIKYNRSSPRRVEIGPAPPADGDRIYVRDNGLGIDPKYHDRIFELFKRVGSGGDEGSGLGLALVRNIVRSHGGQITVESRPGEGSTFFIRFAKAIPR